MGFISSVRIAAGSGSAVLKWLRSAPEQVMSRYGFVCRGGALNLLTGNTCSISCKKANGGYILNVDPNGAGDYFFPYRADRALHCDVPKGLPDGTLVVTFGMNGCALEVHGGLRHNRFYHDADGKVLQGEREAKCRVTREMYEGPGAAAEALHCSIPNGMYLDPMVGGVAQGNFEHTLVCVKKDGVWHVYQTAVVSKDNVLPGFKKGEPTLQHVKDGPPLLVGMFAD